MRALNIDKQAIESKIERNKAIEQSLNEKENTEKINKIVAKFNQMINQQESAYKKMEKKESEKARALKTLTDKGEIIHVTEKFDKEITMIRLDAEISGIEIRREEAITRSTEKQISEIITKFNQEIEALKLKKANIAQ